MRIQKCLDCLDGLCSCEAWLRLVALHWHSQYFLFFVNYSFNASELTMILLVCSRIALENAMQQVECYLGNTFFSFSFECSHWNSITCSRSRQNDIFMFAQFCGYSQQNNTPYISNLNHGLILKENTFCHFWKFKIGVCSFC